MFVQRWSTMGSAVMVGNPSGAFVRFEDHERVAAEKRKDAIDCRKITGDVAVIVSKASAEEALRAIRFAAQQGFYDNLYADDKSFVGAALNEFAAASGGE